MTDNEILAAAEWIKRRRLDQKRLDSLPSARQVTIRWDNPEAPFCEAYTSIEVKPSDVQEIVKRILTARIAADASTKNKLHAGGK